MKSADACNNIVYLLRLLRINRPKFASGNTVARSGDWAFFISEQDFYATKIVGKEITTILLDEREDVYNAVQKIMKDIKYQEFTHILNRIVERWKELSVTAKENAEKRKQYAAKYHSFCDQLSSAITNCDGKQLVAPDDPDRIK